MAENYKHLYEQMKKMVEKYQDEIVPELRRLVDSRVEVVRCKNCKNGEEDDLDFPRQRYCHAGCGWNDADFYCGYGERR